MEHVTNAKVRNQAFWKFMIFFFVTVVIVVTAVYFDYRVPEKENAMLRERVKDFETRTYNQQQFLSTMEASKNLIDSMGKLSQPDVLLERDIVNSLEKLRQYKDSTLYAEMNKEIFIVLDDYNRLNTNFIKSKDAKQRADSLQSESDKWYQKYQEAQRSLDILRRGNSY
jgi:type VI secretion system TssO-like protein